MNLPVFGVRKPITNLMIFSAIIIIALYSLSRLGIDMMPEIEPPAISVISTYPGASPEDVEIKVTEPLENQLATTPGIEKITSRSREGVSALTLKFLWGTNLDEASNDIRDRIEMAKRYLPDIPDEMEAPFIFKFNTAMMPILFVGITADRSYPELYDLIDKKVGDALRQIPGVGTVQLQGGLRRQINVWIDRARLQGYGLSVLDIISVLQAENVTQPAGNLKFGLSDYLIRIPGEFADPSELNTVIVGSHEGRLIYLKDVARVEDGFKEKTDISRTNLRQGLSMMVQKQTGTNTVEVARRVKRKLAELSPALPPDIEMSVIMDTSDDIITSLKSLAGTVWVGGVLVIVVVWFFLRRFRPSLIIALTIPFSLLIAFIYLFLAGKTINVMSLSSLTIAVGMVVDNAIVVVDNIMRHRDRGVRPAEAAIFGTSEMFLSISASTATTVVVFLPMLFITGVVGVMFTELAVIVTVTLLASLFTAATFTPMLCSKLLGQEEGEGPRHFRRLYALFERWFTSWETGYSRALDWCLTRRKTVIFGFSGIFLLCLLLVPLVGSEFAPEEDTGDLSITVQLPIGTRVEESDRLAKRIEEIMVQNVPEKRYINVRSGQTGGGFSAIFGGASGSHVVTCRAKLVPKTERERAVKEIAQDVRKRIKELPGVLKINVSTGNPMGRIITGTGGKAVQIEVMGNSFADTDAVAEEIRQIMEKVPGAVDVAVSRELKRPELRVAVDREKASSLGLNMKTIADSIEAFIEGSTAGRYREKGETYDIVVRLEEGSRTSPEDITSLSVVSPFTKRQIALASVATTYETVGPVEIERQNRERVVMVECNIFERSLGEVVSDISRETAKLTLPPNVTINFGGEAEEQGKAFRDLLFLLILGVAMVYMVMAAQFESLIDPFIVMFAIPFTFTGVIVAFVLTGTTLSIISFLGIIMLMGIVVNNAIVLISYINILRARGLSMREAVTVGGKERLRPVLMTTITTLVGLLPLALSTGQGSETWQPLGITMVSGLAFSTLITMLFIPTLYAVFESHLKKSKKA
jgi:HAE1 family hydrophobic/amphiphilic exporter-1